MTIKTVDTTMPPVMKEPAQPFALRARSVLFTCLTTWEMYPVVILAVFLRFYHLSFTEFDADEATLWNLASTALVHGVIPATANLASLGYANPPGFIYALMVVAAFTSNPLAGALLIALLSVLTVILTFLFTCRYYGRLAATFAALLCTVTFQVIHYSRFIWQPNLLPLFALLFVMTLFWGAVERRPGWFALALPLLACLLQLHLLTIYLVFPFALALALGWRTVRWRDVVVGIAGFVLLFSPYLVWEATVHFVDLSILLSTLRGPASIDGQAINFYLDILAPATVSTAPLAFPAHLFWVKDALGVLLLCGFLLAVSGLCGWQYVRVMIYPRESQAQASPLLEASRSLREKCVAWWDACTVSPQRRGFLLLLAWQLVPLALLSRHSVTLQFHYVLFLLPGPFILIGLFISQVMDWTGHFPVVGRRWLSLAFPALALLLIGVQALNSFAWVLDTTGGYSSSPLHTNTLQDLQTAMEQADQLARSHHLHHIYIYTDQYTYAGLTYLAGQMETPHTVLSGSGCLLLPGIKQGPAVVLLGPADTLASALLAQFASVALVSEPSRLGGAPFHLYIVQPLSFVAGSVSFVNALTLDQRQPAVVSWHDPAQAAATREEALATFWMNEGTWSAADDTYYTYRLTAAPAGSRVGSATGSAVCTFTSIASGEQLIVPFSTAAGTAVSSHSLTVSGAVWVTRPYEKSAGPLHFLSVQEQPALLAPFRSEAGGDRIVVPGK